MITTPQDRLDMHKLRSMAPMTIRFLEVKCRLAADVWRLLSVAERPSGQPFTEVITPVVVNDHGPRAVVLTSGQYDTLIGRVHDLERAVTEGGTA